MEKIEDIDTFSEKYVFEEYMIYTFLNKEESNEFVIVLDNPNISNLKEERGFLFLRFSDVQDYRRNKGMSKIDNIENFYQKEEGEAIIDVRELTIGYEEITNKKSFFLYMGVSYGDISFYFENLFVDKLETYIKLENDSYIYINKLDNKKINFYNPFNL